MVPLNIQEKGQRQIDSLINEIIQKDGIDVYAFHSGLDYNGSSLGSESFQTLRKPDIAMLVNDGVSASGAGEMWHLFDTRFEIPVTMIPVGVFNTANLSRYNTIIFPSGTYGTITDAAKERLKAWTQNGGVLIGLESAINWFQAAGLGTFNVKKDEGIAANGNTTSRAYSDIEEFTGAQRTSGAIFEATVDLSHPLLYGYLQKRMSLFKGNNLFLEKAANVYGNPLVYTATPLMSGYISKQNLAKVKESSIAGISALGRGRVIGFTENLAFRAFWVGTNKLLMNAIFFGSLIDPATAR